MRGKDIAGGIINGIFLGLYAAWVFFWHYRDLENVVSLGSLSMGAVFGWMLRYFLIRMRDFESKNLALLITAVIGSTVVAVFQPFGGGHDLPPEFFYYPIGLAIGFFAQAVWNLFVERSTS